MSSIDERIVGMKFDNAQFEKGISTSKQSLDNLDKALQLKDGSKGLSGISQAAGKLSFDSVIRAADTINNRLSTLGIMGVSALVNIANQAVNTGMTLARSLTVDPIMDGFREYELKMGSIQTILANTARHGTGLTEVTKNLDDLNAYADKTIYNFGDMTRNVGLFTNAGIKVGDATSMIKGFSNEAAASGATAQGAAGAAYQLSQALSAGTIRLMDWRSLQNVGMGNKNMQIGLIELTSAMKGFEGTGMTAKKATKDFNGSLEKGWLSADVMSNYLKIMAGDMSKAEQKALGLSDAQIKAFAKQQKMGEEAATKVRTWTQLFGTLQEAVGSGWAQTFDLIIGDFEQATDLFTAVNDNLGPIIDKMSDTRNDLLKAWVEGGGRDDLLEGLANVWKALLALAKPIGEAFSSIFDAITPDDLIGATEAFKNFTSGLIVGEETAAKLKRTFSGVFAIFSIAGQIIGAVVSAFLRLFGAIAPAGAGILDFTAGIGDFLVSVDAALKKSNAFGAAFDWIGEKVQYVANRIRFAAMLAKIYIFGWINDMQSAAEGFSSFDFDIDLNPFTLLGNAFSWLGEAVTNGWSVIGPALDAIGTGFAMAVGWISGSFNDLLHTFDFGQFLSTINTGLLTAVLVKIIGFFKGLKDAKNESGGIGDALKGVITGLTDTLGAMQNTLNAGTLILIAGAIAILAFSAAKLATIDAGALAKSLGAITVMIGQLFGMMALFQTISKDGGFVQMGLAAKALIAFAIAINILASAVEKFAALDAEGLAKGLTGVVVLLGSLTRVSKVLSSNAGSFMKGAMGLIPFAIAIRILASAVEKIAALDLAGVAKGTGAVVILMGALAGISRLASGSTKMASIGIGLLLVAVALRVLTGAVEQLASLELGNLAKGTGAIIILLGALEGFSTVAGGAKKMISLGVGMIAIAAAMKILSGVLQTLGGMSMESIGKSLVTLGASLLIIQKVMAKMTTAIGGALAMLIVAAALNVLAPVLFAFGAMEWDAITRGLTMLAVSVLAIGVAANMMTGAAAGAAAMILMAVALNMIAPVLMAFGAMDLAAVGTSLLMLVGVFTVLGVAGLVLTPIVPILLLLGAAIALIGVGALAAGVGMMAFAVGITALAAAGAAGTAALVASLSAIIGLFPFIAVQIGLAIVAIITTIADSASTIMEAAVQIGTAFLEGIQEMVPEIAETLLMLLTTVIEGLGELSGTLIEVGTQLILDLLDAIEILIPEFADTGMKIISGILEGIANNIGEVVDQGAQIAINFMDGVAEKIPEMEDSAVNLVNTFVTSVVDAIIASHDHIKSEGDRLLNALTDGAWDAVRDGISETPGKIQEWITSIITEVQDAASWLRDEAVETGKNLARGLDDGIRDGLGWVRDAARDLASQAVATANNVLGVHSPSKEFIKIGKFVREGFAIGLLSGDKEEFIEVFKDLREEVKKLYEESVKDYATAKKKLKDLQAKEKKLEKGKTTGSGKKKKTTVDKEALKKNRAQQKELKASMKISASERDRAKVTLHLLDGEKALVKEQKKSQANLKKLQKEENKLKKAKKPDQKAIKANQKAQKAEKKTLKNQEKYLDILRGDGGRKDIQKELKGDKKRLKKLQDQEKKLKKAKKPDQKAIKANQKAQKKELADIKANQRILDTLNTKGGQAQITKNQKKSKKNLEALQKEEVKLKKAKKPDKKAIEANAKAQKKEKARIKANTEALKIMNIEAGPKKFAQDIMKKQKVNAAEQKASKKRLKELQKEENKLKKAKKPDQKAIKANQKAQGEENKRLEELRRQAKSLDSQAKSPAVFVGVKKALAEMNKDYGKLVEKIEEANDAYQDALKVRDDYAASIFDKYSAIGSLPSKSDYEQYAQDVADGLEGIISPFKQFHDDLRQQIEDNNLFHAVLNDLRGMGLNDTMYAKLVESGTDALPFAQELKKGGKIAVNEINTLADDVELSAKKLSKTASTELYQAGVDAAKGILDGLKSQEKSLKAEMEKLAGFLVTAIKDELKIKSPSRVMQEIGQYTGEGLVNGIASMAPQIEKTAASISTNTIESMREAISRARLMMSSGIGDNPTIRPVIDLEGIRSGVSTMNGLLATSSAIDTQGFTKASNIVQARSVSDSSRTTPSESVVFNQYNTSPKALSEAEIYRQTRNQLSVIKQRLEV